MLSLVIPTYRERDNIEPLLTRLGAVAPALGEPIEVLIVDNASDDGTADLARTLFGQVVPGRVVEPAGRCGLAEAVLLGIREASGDLIAVMDADLSHPPELLPRLVEAVRAGRQMAVASRYTPGGGVEGWPRLRRLLSRLGNLAARPLTTVADTTAGYFVIRAELLRPLALKGQGFKILLEILVQGCLHDVEEVPYVFRDRVRGQSKLSGRVLGSYAAQLARLYAHRLRHACPHERTVGMSAGMTERLSVVILTKNEERRIARCLESVRWADEIVVVDGMSADRTVEICERFGARVIRHAFEGSFAQERNLGMEHATGDWVLQIDADDVVTPDFRQAVERVLGTPSAHVAFRFRRKSILMGRFMRYGGWHHWLPNLVRRDAVRYVGRVHERPELHGTVGQLDADIEHYPCDDLAAFISRHNRYTSLQAEELAASGRWSQAGIRRELARRPWKTFWKSYVKKQGFREGFHGLFFSLFFAWVEFVKWSKCWELSAAAEANAPEPAAAGVQAPSPEPMQAS